MSSRNRRIYGAFAMSIALVLTVGLVESVQQLDSGGRTTGANSDVAGVPGTDSVGGSNGLTPLAKRLRASQLKPVIRGLIAQGGFPSDTVLPELQGVVANATWAQLQPTLNANQTLTLVHPNPIDNVLNSVQKDVAKNHVLVKVRIFAGKNSPSWAMNLDGPAFQMNDFLCASSPPPPGCNGGSLTYWYPKWWGPTYQAAYDRFERALGAAYDGLPVISEVNSPRCMMVWTEPMTRPWEIWSETSLLNAGYTVPSDIACLEQEMISQANAWPHTLVTVNLNPYNDIVWKNGLASRTEDPATTQAVIDYCRVQLGAQCILENDELGRPSATPGDATYSFLYPMMLAAGVGLSYEVDNPGYTHNRALNQTLDVAVSWRAYSVELGYDYLNSKPPSFFAPYNLAFQGGFTCVSAALTPDRAAPQLAGTVITFTATSTGCLNPVYAFWFQYPDGTWVQKQAFSAGATWIWNSTGFAASPYTIHVWANNVGSDMTKFQTYGTAAYVLNSPPRCATASLSPATSSQAAGATINFTASSTACPNPLYEFWIGYPDGTWVMAQTFGTSAAFSWTTTGLAPGTYYVHVWANETGDSQTAFEAYGSSTVNLS